MMKKYFIVLLKVLGILFLLFLAANFGINFWLKNKLPDYIKNNSDYKIAYQSLDVDLGTGNILATGISVNNKNPENQNVIRLQGTVDTLSVSRLGIFDALFRNRINSSDLLLISPNLNLILAKPVDDKTGKKRNPMVLKNVMITSGTIQIFKHTKQKFLSVQDLNVAVENLQMTEEAVEHKLPVVFDRYDINGKNFFFRPGNLYAITTKYITTKNGKMSLQNFALVPLLSYSDFRKYYPHTKNLFDFKTSEIQFKDIVLTGNTVKLTNADFKDPELKIYTANVKPQRKKDFTFVVNMEEVVMNNAKIAIVKPTGKPLLNVENISLNINKFLMNADTSKQPLPFQYADFKISGKNIDFSSATENVKIAGLAVTPKSAELSNLTVKPIVSSAAKTLLDLTVQKVNVNINEFKFLENKLKLNIQNVLINQLNGKIAGGTQQRKKNPNFTSIHFPLTIHNISLKNSNLVYEKEGNALAVNDVNATVQQVEFNEKTVRNAIPFKTGFYSATTRNFTYGTKFYTFSSSLVKVGKKAVQMSNVAMKPKVSRAQFIRMIPTEKDLYDIKVTEVNLRGDWDFLSPQKFLNAPQLTLNGMNANIFRSKIPEDDLTEKPMYSKLLRSIKFPLYIENIDVINSVLVYEEDTKKSDGPGKLTFGSFNMNVKNLNSGKMAGKTTQVPISISCLFMNASPMKVKWNFDTASITDDFSISGNISDLPASRVNPFIEPYLKVRATGLISDLIFDFKGNFKGLNGTLKMKHKDLRVSILRQTGEKNKVLSAVANLFMKNNSGNYPESVSVENVERDPTKSFFNLFWKGIEHGLKKTLIGKNIQKTEQKAKTTVANTKTAVQKNKDNLKEKKEEVKEKIQTRKENVKENGIFRNLFRKKSEN